MDTKTTDSKRNKITNLFKWGTLLLVVSTILLTITIYFDNKITHNRNIIDTYETNHNEYVNVDMMNNIYQSTFKLGKLLKDDNVDTIFKKSLMSNLDTSIHNLRVQCAVLQYPGNIIVTEDMQRKLLALPASKLEEVIKINNDKNIEILNKSSKVIKRNEVAKTTITFLIILFQILGLSLNQWAVILQIRYKI